MEKISKEEFKKDFWAIIDKHLEGSWKPVVIREFLRLIEKNPSHDKNDLWQQAKNNVFSHSMVLPIEESLMRSMKKTGAWDKYLKMKEDEAWEIYWKENSNGK